MTRFTCIISKDEYKTLENSQGGVCAICGGPPNLGMNVFCADRKPLNGKARGLLCACCHRVIGLADYNVELLEKAVAYLRRSSPDADGAVE